MLFSVHSHRCDLIGASAHQRRSVVDCATTWTVMPLRSQQWTAGSTPANDRGKPAAESRLRRVLWVIGVLMIVDLAIAALLPH
jgi:hypothetical protein